MAYKPNPRFFIRRLPTVEADLFLDEIFLAWGVRATPTPNGARLQNAAGVPILRVLHHKDGNSTLYFSADHFTFKEQ